MDKTLREIQQELLKIKTVCFKGYPNAVWHPASRALNVNEEAGELAREERLALDHGGLNEELAVDAVGDVFISTIGYCIARGWDAQDILEKVFQHIKDRWQSGQLVGDPDEWTRRTEVRDTRVG